MRSEYQDALDDLHLQVEVMAELVRSNLALAEAVLRTGDDGVVGEALRLDDEIDAINVSLMQKCYDLLAVQAPVAGDLRLIVSVVRVTADLERVGDLALRVVKRAPDQPLLAAHPTVHRLLCEMAPLARRAAVDAMRAWSTRDAREAAALMEAPPATGHRAQELAAALAGLGGPHAVAVAVSAWSIGQALDRIADHARVIAARVSYLVTGDTGHLVAEVR